MWQWSMYRGNGYWWCDRARGPKESRSACLWEHKNSSILLGFLGEFPGGGWFEWALEPEKSRRNYTPEKGRDTSKNHKERIGSVDWILCCGHSKPGWPRGGHSHQCSSHIKARQERLGKKVWLGDYNGQEKKTKQKDRPARVSSSVSLARIEDTVSFMI